MPLFKSSRKVQAFGSSLALTIPAMYARINEIRKGNKIRIFYDLDGTMIMANCRNEKELKACILKFLQTLDDSLSDEQV